MENRKYISFMYDENNYKNCEECPENWGCEEGSSRIAGPCGQQEYWVAVHCRHLEAEEELFYAD